MLLDKIVQGLVDVAQGQLSSRTRPKAKAARAFVRLYAALIECHEAYLRCRSHGLSGDEYLLRSPHYATWRHAINDLALALQQVKTEIRLFAPDVHKQMVLYLNSEELLGGSSGSSEAFIHGDQRQIKRLADLIIDKGYNPCIFSPDAEHNPEGEGRSHDELEADAEMQKNDLEMSVSDDATYSSSERRLRNFIKKQFAIEDLF